MVDNLLRNHLDYLCETWAGLTDDQKLRMLGAAPDLYLAAVWLIYYYTINERGNHE